MPNDDRGTVAISLVQASLALARKHGAQDAILLARAGIAPALLTSPQARVPAKLYGALWNAIAQTIDDEFFGQDSHPMRSGSFVAMSQTALTARTGLKALTRAVHFMRCVLDDVYAEIEPAQDRIRLRFVHRKNIAEPTMFMYATYFILVYGLTCWLIDRRIPILQACFQCSKPAAADEYRLMFCDDMRFAQPVSYVDFDPQFGALPVIRTPQTLTTFLRNAPANFIVKYRNPDALAVRVRGALRILPPAAWPTANTIAANLHIATPTLRRKLRQEGHSYQSIKDTLRRDLALAALADARRSVADVAVLAGFAEPSAFYRAFRKWTGLCPAHYRTSQLRRGVKTGTPTPQITQRKRDRNPEPLISASKRKAALEE